MIRHYPSPQAILAAYEQAGSSASRGDLGDSWYGGESRHHTIRLTAQGDTSLVPAAEAQIEALDLAIGTPRRQWDRSPCGPIVSVPDLLAGLPTPMRRLQPTTDDHAPITILACTTASGSLSAESMARRGTTILALTMALSRIRPVDLRLLSIMHGRDTGETVFTIDIDTKPLDLASACYLLTSAGFTRRLTYGLGRALNGFNGSWPRQYEKDGAKAYYAGLLPRLGLDPTTTLLIEAAHANDSLVNNPLPWINAQISRFSTQTQTEEA